VSPIKKKLHGLLPRKTLSANHSPSGSLTKINANLLEGRQQLWDFRGRVQSLDQQFQALQGLWSQVWTEREQLHNEYYELLNAILESCDVLEESIDHPQFSQVHTILNSILLKHGIEKNLTRIGDPFQPEIHECEETTYQDGLPDGVIVQVITPCYLRIFANGEHLVIRPARVIVNRAAKVKTIDKDMNGEDVL